MTDEWTEAIVELATDVAKGVLSPAKAARIAAQGMSDSLHVLKEDEIMLFDQVPYIAWFQQMADDPASLDCQVERLRASMEARQREPTEERMDVEAFWVEMLKIEQEARRGDPR